MNNKGILSYLVIIVIFVGVLVILGSRNANSSVVDANDPNRPQAGVEDRDFDFGNMTNSELREHTFVVTNNGQSDLTLTNVSTSCDCTYAYINANGQTSPKFTMHGDNRWTASVKPGEQASVKVVYEPAIMPVHGTVTRTVAVTTNDPNQPSLEFNIRANLTD